MLQDILRALPFLVSLFWLVLLTMQFFMSSNRNDTPRKVLVIASLVVSLASLGNLIATDASYNLFFRVFFDVLTIVAFLSICCISYIYFTLFVGSDINRSKILMFVPALFFGVVYSVLYIFMDSYQIENFLFSISSGFILRVVEMDVICKVQFCVRILAFFYYFVQLIFFVIKIFGKMSAFNSILRQYFSVKQYVNFSYLNLLFICALSAHFLFFASHTINALTNTVIPVFNDAVYILFAICIFALFFCGLEIHNSQLEFNRHLSTSKTTTAASPDLKFRIIELFEKDKLYLKPNLKVSDISKLLNVNNQYVYNAICVDMGTSFAQLVNGYRIRYAQELLVNNPDMSISNIASNSGYTTDVSFYNNFKTYTGTTPTKWKNVLFCNSQS